MKALTDEDLRINEQAKEVAASVLGDSVLAATRCEQITQDMQAEAAGVGGVVRGMAKFARGQMTVMSKVTPGMGSVEKMGKELRGGGLPKSFVLAVTDKQVAALEDKQKGGQLAAGKVLKSWGRDDIHGRAGVAVGVPGDDRQQLTLYIPMGESKNKYMRAAAAQQAKVAAQYGQAAQGQPVRFLVAKDAASQAVIDELSKNAPAPGANVMIGGQSVADMMAAAGGGAAAGGPTEQLAKLADLHERGVLSDEEFAAQKAKILDQS
jgi:hypothetical protein